ncbi:MAG: HTH-type transcriptional activator AaeR [Rouxiella aceris]|uniref:HTH-type transcriptional activator AaeR n=1 Tax=Rouxiella aceris TaxID=2703884 RepID=UPI0028520066|nr:HTH-type transcriptional activator AaeR [Rouxiella aceris]MDR3430646.1 HTH-type transcriptional activator AaeR [Rouxiella aceris]
MDRLKRMSVFAQVVESGSYTAAALRLKMSVSAISQSITKLENELQIKLLNRSTRSLGLTEAGKIYYQGCQKMLQSVREVHEQLYAFNNTPTGTLRIGSSSTMAQNVLAAMTAKMLGEYPGLTVNLVTGIPAPDLIADGLDLVIRVGKLQDSSLFSKLLGAMPMVVCSAKSYLSQHGKPETPEDMVNFTWLEYSVRHDSDFDLITPEGQTMRIAPEGRFITNDAQTMIRWLKSGVGIAYVPLMWIIDEINTGEVEILFGNYQTEPRPVYALYTERDKLPLKVQVCINYLTDYFKEVSKIYRIHRKRESAAK